MHRSMHGVRRTSSARRTAHAGGRTAFPGRLTAAPPVHRPVHALSRAFVAPLTGSPSRFTASHAVHRAMHGGARACVRSRTASDALHRSMHDHPNPFSSLPTGRVAGRNARSALLALSSARLCPP